MDDKEYVSVDEVNQAIRRLKSLGYKIDPYPSNLLAQLQVRKSHADTRTKMNTVNSQMLEITSLLPKKMKETATLSSIDTFLLKQCCERKLFPSVFGYMMFPKVSCISPNYVACHGMPYKTKLKSGDIVTVDFCLYNGVHSDWAETYCIGNVSGEKRKLVATTRECLKTAAAICRPGQPYNVIGNVVSKIAKENGFNVVERYGGHGIGSKLHMAPFIQNSPNNNVTKMKVGDMFTIEPILTTGSGETTLARDGYSILERDKMPVAHFERVVLITDRGSAILNGEL